MPALMKLLYRLTFPKTTCAGSKTRNNQQISTFTAVAWFKMENVGEIQKQSFALVSDYLSHDKYPFDICLSIVFSEIIEIVPNIKQARYSPMEHQAILSKNLL